MLSNSLRFISNNVKGIQSFEKRIEIFEYLKKATSCGFIFLQETHSTIHDEKKWNDEFKEKLRKTLFFTWSKQFLRSRYWFHW